MSLRQSIIPDALLGRVNSVYRFLGWGTMPIGAAVGGALAKGFGLRAPFFANAGVLAIMGVAPCPWSTGARSRRPAPRATSSVSA